jgi:glycosidase
MMRALLALALVAMPVAAAPAASAVASFRDRLPEDETVYFLLPDRFDNGVQGNDRGGIRGDRLQTGFDPTAKGFYHGGDLQGLIRRLDYIKALGATAVWVAPIFRNNPVQGAKGEESAGYHGYWVTDFTRVDPHFGSDADFAAFVAAAHARGLKVYMDIIANHTADVIQYRECLAGCTYRSVADYPWWKRASTGEAINSGFAGLDDGSAANFARMTDGSHAYTPFVPPAAAHLKKPEWLNDPIHYHNRGNSTFAGESATLGDFSGLDDLMTEDPAVVQGFIDIYGSWIDRFGIDGYRIDTAKHVDPAFWQQFVPAMLARARAKGIPNFHIFGEVYSDSPDAGVLATHTRVDKLPSVLDFAFHRAVVDTAGGLAGTDELAALFAGDALYEGGEMAALRLPTFLGNHDAGRFGYFARKALPQADDTEILQREMLANAMLFGLRGVPVVYAGDEQGFAGDGGDQDSREDQFGSKVASYNDNRLLGTDASTATPRFDTAHPLYRQIAGLAAIRAASPALRRGRQVTRASGDKPGLFAVSRFDPGTGAETVLAFNTSTAPITANIAVAPGSTAFETLAGSCPAAASATGSLAVTLPPLGYAFCAAGKQ